MGFSSFKVKDFLQLAKYLKSYDLEYVAKHCSKIVVKDTVQLTAKSLIASQKNKSVL